MFSSGFSNVNVLLCDIKLQVKLSMSRIDSSQVPPFLWFLDYSLKTNSIDERLSDPFICYQLLYV